MEVRSRNYKLGNAATYTRRAGLATAGAVAELCLVRRTHRMSIESDIVERVNRAASKKQIPISDTKQK